MSIMHGDEELTPRDLAMLTRLSTRIDTLILEDTETPNEIINVCDALIGKALLTLMYLYGKNEEGLAAAVFHVFTTLTNSAESLRESPPHAS